MIQTANGVPVITVELISASSELLDLDLPPTEAINEALSGVFIPILEDEKEKLVP